MGDFNRFEPIPQRILDRIDASGDCWEWTGCKAQGYGLVSLNGRMLRVHRLTYEALVGPVLDGLELDHLCRSRACCNPDHLEPVPHAENIRRSAAHLSSARRNLEVSQAKRRAKTHCKWGHALSDAFRPPSGGRKCRTCTAIRQRKYRSRKRSEVAYA